MPNSHCVDLLSSQYYKPHFLHSFISGFRVRRWLAALIDAMQHEKIKNRILFFFPARKRNTPESGQAEQFSLVLSIIHTAHIQLTFQNNFIKRASVKTRRGDVFTSGLHSDHNTFYLHWHPALTCICPCLDTNQIFNGFMKRSFKCFICFHSSSISF